MFRNLISFFLAAALMVSCHGNPAVYDLRCEGMDQPLGIDSGKPHFSWKISSEKAVSQKSYEIEVASSGQLLESGQADLWKSGTVNSDESVMVPYCGTPLSSRQMCWWRVKVLTSGGASQWSPVQRFSVGIIGGDTFKGEYISMGAGCGNALLLEKTFPLPQAGNVSLLHVNSLGYHEVYVNGVRVSDSPLSPAVSQMNIRSLIVTYDVTDMLKEGENSIVLWIGSGWYKPGTFNAAYDGPVVRADLDVMDADGWRTVVATDSSWRGSLSGYEDTGSWGAWGFGGEVIDAGSVPSDLSADAMADREWKTVETVHIESIEATPQMCLPNKVKETVAAVDIKPCGDGEWLVDFGKVMNGQVEFRLPSLPAGSRVEAVYSDHLEEDGSMVVEDDTPMDVFISSGSPEGDVYRDKFNHHCLRYVLLRNLPLQPRLADLKVNRIGYGSEVTGTFECSDPDLNAIHQMLSYTMDNLAFSGYMVDCAHIERLGYGGDGNASTLSLQNNFDVAPLYMNWLQAWNDVIREDGGLPHTAPCPYRAGGGPYWCSFIVQAPWRVWMNYADDRLLKRCYPSMKKWLKYVDAYTVDGLLSEWPETEYRSWYLGDWLPPTGVDPRMEESVALVDNCALAQSYRELIQIAEHLGLPEDAAEYRMRRDALVRRINEKFYHPETSSYGTGVQIDMAYPLLAGVVPSENTDTVTLVLKKYTEEKMAGHIGVGLVGVPVLAEWATLAGEVDFVYGMLKKEDYPGYLYMLRNGATGTWEEWNHPRSYLHNCYNGMDSWFYQALGGIIPLEPGYRKVLIAPQYPEGVDWVKVTRETPYGTIKVEWRRGERGIELNTVLPNGVTAQVRR